MRKLTTNDFWNRVNKSGPNNCWIWTGPSMGRYGGFGRREYAHRASWRINNGPIPDGMQVLHKCDITICVNPLHLYLGSQADNIHDIMSRHPGVQYRGSRLGSKKILEMIDLYKLGTYNQRELADIYGISDSQVWALINSYNGAGIYTLSREAL